MIKSKHSFTFLQKNITQHFITKILTGITVFFAIYLFIGHSIEYNSAIFHQPNRHISGLFNSNQLNISYLYQDLFVHHAPLKDWFFSPVPYFFPDVFIYFLLMNILKNFILAALLTNAVLIFLYYCLLVAIGTLIYGKQNKNIFRLSGLLSLFLASNHLGDSEILVPLWSSHFGSTVVMFLVGIFLTLKILHLSSNAVPRSPVGATNRSPLRIISYKPSLRGAIIASDSAIMATRQSKKIYYILLGIILFLTSFSDPLFFVLFVPSILTGVLALILKKIINKTTFLKISAIILIAGLLGFSTNYFDLFHLNIQQTIIPGDSLTAQWQSVIQTAIQKIIHLQNNFSLYYHHNSIIIFIAFFFFIFGIKLFFKSNEKINPNNLFIFIVTAFCMLISLLSSIFLDPDLNLPTFTGLRHFQAFILFPTFLCLPLILAQYKEIVDFINYYYIYFILAIMSSLLLFAPHYSFNTMLHFQSPVTECIDMYSKQGKLISKNGISAYWDAHIIDMFSQENINLVAVTHTPLKPYNWMGTQYDYLNKKFNFILLKQHTAFSRVAPQHWKNPDHIQICPQDKNYSLYIYNQGFYIDKL